MLSDQRPWQCVPPSPQLMKQLYKDYLRARGDTKISFKAYLKRIGLTDPGAELKGGDEGTRAVPARKKKKLVAAPLRPVTGQLRLLVLLVDFSDKKGRRRPREYEDLLFSNGTFRTRSLRDFYAEVSCGKVDIVGSVHGWLRMPKKYSYYVNKKSGYGKYPKNSVKLAGDAVKAAIARKIPFAADLDKFGDGAITGLVIVHAGHGAEAITTKRLADNAIWSHKADLKKPVKVGPNLYATNYVAVPEDCRVGVCAHELGHLVFQWGDFYAPNFDNHGSKWDGSGVWDLMASGNWNDDGLTPGHPAGLHKSLHDWIEIREVTCTTKGLVVPPFSKHAGQIVRIRCVKFSETQCLILENRERRGFDRKLPGRGLLVWRVDTRRKKMLTPKRAGMLLIQADGRHDLENPDDDDIGDAGDPFPGSKKRHVLLDTGDISTSFPGVRCGVVLKNIVLDTRAGTITLDVVFS